MRPPALLDEPSQRRAPSVCRRFLRHRLAVAGAGFVVILTVLAVLAGTVSLYPRDQIQLRERSQAPSAQHWFGTDSLGRDVFTRVVHGARVSLQVGFFAVAISGSLGVLIGAVAGFYGGLTDNALMRLTDIFISIPFLYLAVTAMAFFRPGVLAIILTLGLTSWAGLARLVRGEFLSLRGRDYVEAAHAAGSAPARIIFRHLLPNAMGPIVVSSTLRVAGAIVSEAALSYLGIGIQPPTPSWGNMLLDGQAQILRGAWWLTVFPGAAIFLTVMAFNAMGDGLRDALDPKMR